MKKMILPALFFALSSFLPMQWTEEEMVFHFGNENDHMLCDFVMRLPEWNELFSNSWDALYEDPNEPGRMLGVRCIADDCFYDMTTEEMNDVLESARRNLFSSKRHLFVSFSTNSGVMECIGRGESGNEVYCRFFISIVEKGLGVLFFNANPESFEAVREDQAALMKKIEFKNVEKT